MRKKYYNKSTEITKEEKCNYGIYSWENNKLKIKKYKSKKIIGGHKIFDSSLGKGKYFSSFSEFFFQYISTIRFFPVNKNI